MTQRCADSAASSSAVETRLRGWGERTRTRKCRFFEISAELLTFPEHFGTRDFSWGEPRSGLQSQRSRRPIPVLRPTHCVKTGSERRLTMLFSIRKRGLSWSSATTNCCGAVTSFMRRRRSSFPRSSRRDSRAPPCGIPPRTCHRRADRPAPYARRSPSCARGCGRSRSTRGP
jgi:hypothetical protein